MRGIPSAVALIGAFWAAAALARDAPGVPPVPESGPVEGSRPRSEARRYSKKLKLLRTFHDGGPMEESDVLRVLEGAGVIPTLGGQFRPFHEPDFQGRWLWPLRAGVVSSEFGPRWGRRHEGIDVAADRGVPVLAAASGVVIYAGDGLRGYGNALILRHDQSTVSLYAHNDSLEASVGQRVERGQAIARLGSTGRSTGPHVHFEIRVKRKALDPRTLLPKSNRILK